MTQRPGTNAASPQPGRKQPTGSRGKKMIEDYRSGQPVDEVFLVSQNELKAARTGSLYLQLTFADRSGSIPGRFWDASETLHNSFAVDDFVRVNGKTDMYQGDLQIIVRSITRLDPDGLDLSDFLPASDQNPDAMLKELADIMAQIEDPHLSGLIRLFLADEALCDKLRKTPAATEFHHAYLGGLLEHTLSLARLGLHVLDHYPQLDRDLFLAGIFLHDIGKTRELSYARTFQYTDEGNLIGHLAIGVLMIEEKARQMDGFPEEQLNVLCHIVLSHHGEYEYGSPKLPSTIESVALHYLDNLDAKIQCFAKAIAEDRNTDSRWTDYVRGFRRKLYKGRDRGFRGTPG